MKGMTVNRISRNVHRIEVTGKETMFAIFSDLHWDNPKCDRKKLSLHLEYCKNHNIPIFINGDFFLHDARKV